MKRTLLIFLLLSTMDCGYECNGIWLLDGRVCAKLGPMLEMTATLSLRATETGIDEGYHSILDCAQETSDMTLWVGKMTAEQCDGHRACVNGLDMLIDYGEGGCFPGQSIIHEFLHIIANECLDAHGDHIPTIFCDSTRCSNPTDFGRPEHLAFQDILCDGK